MFLFFNGTINMQVFGYMYSSAGVSGQKPGMPIDIVVFPISGHTNPSNYAGAIPLCMFKWNPTKNNWIPFS